jgi:site-specific DNA recombinase
MGVFLEQLDLGLDLTPGLAPPRGPSLGSNRQLTDWVSGSRRSPRRSCGRGRAGAGVRFAFYGRVSTLEYQDPVSSLGWQRDSAIDVIADRGRIVTEFFDVGYSRTVPWALRRQAARLLEAVTNPARGFDAIIVGESERAFTGTQLLHLAQVFLAHGVQVWLPELDGPVDLTDPAHQALIMRLGERARREVARARYRTTAAMRVQARDQGRYLRGRPPYGYRLVDAGPHPNAAHAAWGRRLQRLDPDPNTAPHVKWIFARRLTGASIAGIARDLNDRGVPCPSGADPERNPHRRGRTWMATTVASILANPRYTGRQVWNRQRTDHHVDGGRIRIQHWNPTDQWVISTRPAHPELVSTADYTAAQAVKSVRAAGDGTLRAYLLAGQVQCGICGRRLDSHWVNNRPGYRCRHGHTSATATTSPDQKPYVYVREDELLQHIATTLRRGSGRPPATTEIPRLLRDQELTIICDNTRRSLRRAPAAHGSARAVG